MHGFSLKGAKAGKEGMSSFQALTTAIAAQVGTGNITGCATALYSGGPGAIFWMWLSAFFGMSTIYGEAVLAQKYKTVGDDGHVTGGPIYYIKARFQGKFGKFLAGFFSLAIIFALGFTGNMVQVGDDGHVTGGPIYYIKARFQGKFGKFLAGFFSLAIIFALGFTGNMVQAKDDGHVTGGPIYYIKARFQGKFGKFLAGFFSLAIIFALGFTGNMVQANSISSAFKTAFGVDPRIVGVICAVIAAFIFLGGVRRIASFTEKVVPVMAIFYMVGCVVILFINHEMLIPAIKSIFVAAFDPRAILGGAVGITVREAMRYGVARGLFSNEAGMGSTPHAHALAKVEKPQDQGVIAMIGVFVDTFIVLTLTRGLFSNEAGMGSTPHAHALAKVEKPQDQGVIAMIGVFVDTFIVLTLTALVILTSGQLQAGVPGALEGTDLAQAAFNSAFGSFGNIFVAICMLFFAFSTIIGWYFFGESNVKALFGKKAVKIYAAIVVVCIIVGSALQVKLVWNLSDLFNALMVFPNLIALLALSGVVAKAAHGHDITKDD